MKFRGLIAVILFSMKIEAAHSCSLVFANDFHQPPGKIAAMELHVRYYAISNLREVPIGWRITVDGDLNWINGISGTASHYGSFMTFKEFSGMLRFIGMPASGHDQAHSCADLTKQGELSLRFQLYSRDDKMQDYQVPLSALAVEE
jgi:hypothetical protein